MSLLTCGIWWILLSQVPYSLMAVYIFSMVFLYGEQSGHESRCKRPHNSKSTSKSEVILSLYFSLLRITLAQTDHQRACPASSVENIHKEELLYSLKI